jgi:hypothetical protein
MLAFSGEQQYLITLAHCFPSFLGSFSLFQDDLFGEVTMWVMEIAWAAHLGSPPSNLFVPVSLG